MVHCSILLFLRCNVGNVMVITGIRQLIKKNFRKNCSREYVFLLCLQERKNMFVIADVFIALYHY